MARPHNLPRPDVLTERERSIALELAKLGFGLQRIKGALEQRTGKKVREGPIRRALLEQGLLERAQPAQPPKRQLRALTDDEALLALDFIHLGYRPKPIAKFFSRKGHRVHYSVIQALIDGRTYRDMHARWAELERSGFADIGGAS